MIFQLLLGIKDLDDTLVASTLICLSELVPILGADTVIGGKRCKFFTDGRPNCKTKMLLPKLNRTSENIHPDKPLKDLPCSEIILQDNNNLATFEANISLNERPSPVGGESMDEQINVNESYVNKTDSENDWSDWDNSNRQLRILESEHSIIQDVDDNSLIIKNKTEDQNLNKKAYINQKDDLSLKTTLLQKAALDAKRNIIDISELDIKNQKIDYTKKGSDEFDFFADMMPIIEKPTVINVNTDQDLSSKLNFVPDENDGWGENWNE